MNASHSQMKRAALSAESTKSTPPRCFGWFATMPTTRPSMRAKPVRISFAKSCLISHQAALVDDLVDDGHHVEGLVLVGRDDLLDASCRSSFGGARLARAGGARVQFTRHVARCSGAPRRSPSSSVFTSTSPQPETEQCILRAAHLLERHLLADDHLGHARRAEVHARVAVDHDDDVAERGDVRAAGRATARRAGRSAGPARRAATWL